MYNLVTLRYCIPLKLFYLQYGTTAHSTIPRYIKESLLLQELQKHGADSVLEREYGDLVIQPEEGKNTSTL